MDLGVRILPLIPIDRSSCMNNLNAYGITTFVIRVILLQAGQP